MSSPDSHDAATVLAELWGEVRLDPWPADPAAAPSLQDDPVTHAAACAEALLHRKPDLKIGLVDARCGADTLASVGWRGPTNHVRDMGKLAAVAREHLAFCPDNILGCAGGLPAYAEHLSGGPMWSFWWD
jgi:hypothetical protein